jgi:hypothetical protein
MTMSDPSNQPRIDEPRTGVMPGAAFSDLNPSDIELPPSEAPIKREPIFSRRVLIGWALVALIAYFGLHLMGNVIRSTVRETVTAAREGGNSPAKQIIYQSKNGKLTISRDYPGGPIRITKNRSAGARSDAPPDPEAIAEAAAEAAAKATEAAVNAATAGLPAPAKAPPAPVPAPVKR